MGIVLLLETAYEFLLVSAATDNSHDPFELLALEHRLVDTCFIKREVACFRLCLNHTVIVFSVGKRRGSASMGLRC